MSTATPRLSVSDYHRLIACELLGPNDRLELLRGMLVEKRIHSPRHAALIGILQTALQRLLAGSFAIRTQVPITLSDSEPEPDLTIVRGELIDYLTRHPGPQDTVLAIEISDSSLLTDRYKGEIYAEAGIPYYWIVNLSERRVEVYSQPTMTAEGVRYGQPRIYSPGETIPLIVAGQEVGNIAADRLLPVIAG